jgi:pyruvate kinase
MTQSGGTARMVSSFKPLANVYAMTTLKTTFRSLAIIWGVIPVLVNSYNSSDEMPEIAKKKLIDMAVIEKNEKFIITGGIPVNTPGTTNYISIL